MSYRALPTLAAGLLLGAVAFSGIAGAAAAPGDSGMPAPVSTVPRFAPLYMAVPTKTPPTVRDAVAAAKAFDVLIPSTGLAPYVAAMRAANSRLVLVGYENALYSRIGDQYPEDWYAHDSQGRRIRTYTWPIYLMDPTNAGWRQTAASRCAAMVAETHYNGCFLDNLGEGPFHLGYVTASPVNQATGKVWDPGAWMAATAQLASAVRAAVPSATIVANGLVNGGSYFGSEGTWPLIPATDGAMSEVWLRAASDPVTAYRSEADWKADIDMLVAAEARGGRVLATVKLWVPASAAQVASWHRYALASFLLGTSGKAFFNFSTASTWGGIGADSAVDRINIGAAVGPYRAVSGAYVRTYTKGLVLVHPNDGNVTVALGAGHYLDLDGRSVSGSVTLGGHAGSVLRTVS